MEEEEGRRRYTERSTGGFFWLDEAEGDGRAIAMMV